jgi:adenosylcobinamide-phosphate synthase
MGCAIKFLEPRFRRLRISLALGGGSMAALLISGAWGGSWLLLFFAHRLHPLMGLGLGVLMLFYTLSIRSLASAAGMVYKALQRQDIPGARHQLARIVGREVDRLSAEGISRAGVETVAENLVDGVVSPLFYALIGGPAMAMAYKMVNTLDSMIGYKNERYLAFGRWAAKIDDAANYLPARLSAVVIAVAAHWLNRRGKAVFMTARQEARHHLSPNSGWPEAAFAGALRVKLGGPNHYHGRLVNKPFIGSHWGPCRPVHIKQAWELMLLSSLLWATTCWAIQATLTFIF